MRTLHLRRIKTTLRISIPFQFARKHGLTEGDQCIWQETEDGVRLRFIKLEDVAAAAERHGVQVEASAA
jgi:hypothetical protein